MRSGNAAAPESRGPRCLRSQAAEAALTPPFAGRQTPVSRHISAAILATPAGSGDDVFLTSALSRRPSVGLDPRETPAVQGAAPSRPSNSRFTFPCALIPSTALRGQRPSPRFRAGTSRVSACSLGVTLLLRSRDLDSFLPLGVATPMAADRHHNGACPSLRIQRATRARAVNRDGSPLRSDPAGAG